MKLLSAVGRATKNCELRPHAVVIGSGFGGLAAAIRLGAKGYRVTVFEKLDAPGGKAYVYRQDGFTFDAGPTIITAPFLFEELWKLCGRRLEDDIDLRPIDPFYQIRFHDGTVFNYGASPTAMREEVSRLSPSDVEGYEAFMRCSEAIFKVGFEKLGHVPFSSWTDMVRVLPDLVRLSGHKTVYALVSSFVKDQRLRCVLSFHPLLIGGNPFSTTSIYCLIAFLERRWGVHFAMGGTGRLVSGMVSLIESQGGSVKLNSEVRQIVLEKRRATGVLLASGESVAAQLVVSNSDSAWTYRHLLPAGTESRWSHTKVERARYSMGLFVWYFGTRCRYDDVGHHTMLLGPRYEGLLRDIFKHKHLAKDFSLYLHRPTATDRSLAPDGCDAFYVLAPVPHLTKDSAWKRDAESYRQAIEEALSATVLPGLSDQIVTSRMLTPDDFEQRLSCFRGAAFGLEPILTQSAWFRPHNISEDIENLFLVGAGTHPGAGVPGVLSSARILESVIPDAHTFH